MRKWLFGFMTIVTLGLFLFIAGYAIIYINGQNLLMENLEKLDMAEATIVYDKNEKEMSKLFMENRELATLDEIPKKLQEAVIATEDQRFDEHAGVDLWAIGRAIYKDILHRDLVEGGSTITQQVAKNMFLTADKTFFRKATEVSIALALDNNFSKEEILEMYLNRIYFGRGTYGVKAAAKYYFGKSDLSKLSLLEMAVLAGMPKAPETYSPSKNPEKALERAAIVLQLMKDQGYISEEERRAAINDTLSKPSGKTDSSESAILDYILAQAKAVSGLSEDELRIGGFHIYTTVDSQAQRAVDKAFANAELFPEDGPEQKVQGAMVIVDPKTGGIAAMNGGRDYVAKGTNRALSDRQPGSSFKPIVAYAPAIETGKYHPYSMLKDEPMQFGNYKPRNLSGKYAGQVTMMEAARRSINVPTVWLLNEIGVKTGINFAKKLEIDFAPEDRNLAIALGGMTRGVSPLEMARAYGAFANDGKLAETHVITKITDSEGAPIYTYKTSSKEVMNKRTAYYTTLLLQSVVQKGGTGVKANIGRPLAGKTGTTQLGIPGLSDSKGNRDIWFVGYTPDYAAAVWMGFDDTNKSHYLKTGSGKAAEMFAAVMREALNGRKETSFKRPEGVSEPVRAPSAVTDLQAFHDAERRETILSWPASKTANVEYRLYRKETSQQAFELVLSTPATEVVDITLEAGKTYQYYVTVYSPESDAESDRSNIVEVVVPAEDEGTDEGFDLPIVDDLLPGEEPPADEGGGTGDGDGPDGESGGGGTGGDDGTGDGEQPPDAGGGTDGSGGNNGNGNGNGGDGDNEGNGGNGNGNGQPGSEGGTDSATNGNNSGDDIIVVPDGL
ncbi:transglycosylase domain-containing protein [Paenibacillus alkalitolerans]|uniref:transglycosylase domain-containing protein n=1 Tax=Paenibacillus alkalitolerans TaxID=2799335 RepID=UPI001F255ABA|nr:PBP1A family penicillin-binding protein [Paenibacillus alkalitolerans]